MIFRVLPENIFKNFKNIPFDKAIMEKTKKCGSCTGEF